MRLIQKSKEQVGIAVAQDNGKRRFIPLFSKDPLKEAMHISELKDNLELVGVYLALSPMEQISLLEEANKFKKEHNRIPRHIMDQLRTGFAETRGLRQISDICAYE